MLEKFLIVAMILILVLFSLHTNTAQDLYYQYNLKSFHKKC